MAGVALLPRDLRSRGSLFKGYPQLGGTVAMEVPSIPAGSRMK